MIKIPETEVYIGGGHKGHLFLTNYDEDGWWIVENYNCDSIHSIYQGLIELNKQSPFTHNVETYFKKYYHKIKEITQYIWDHSEHYGHKCYDNPFETKCDNCSRLPNELWSIDYKEPNPTYFKELIEELPKKNNFLDKRPSVEKDNRKTKEYVWWGKAILKRDGSCVVCGHNDKLEAHHLFGFKEHSDIATDMGNGVTLCKWCHQKYHSIYGTQNINPVDFMKFKDKFGVRL